MELTSRDNRLIKEYRRLSDDAHFRRSSGCFVVEGARLCSDAVQSGVNVRAAFFTEQAIAQYPEQAACVAQAAKEVFTVSLSLSRYLADTASPQGLFCVAERPVIETAVTWQKTGIYAALEAVQDPGNVGTMIRTAEAFGLSGVLLAAGCCDPYSPKVLRASMGGVFRLPLYVVGALAQTLPLLHASGLRSVACVVDENACPIQQAALGAGTVVVIGNEGNGLCPETVQACTERATIPMAGRAESLNASMAAGIALWEAVRKGGAYRA